MQLAGPYAFGPPPDRASAIGVLRAAVAAGVDHIHTAPAADPGRRRRGRGRDVLDFPADRARRLRRPAARPEVQVGRLGPHFRRLGRSRLG